MKNTIAKSLFAVDKGLYQKLVFWHFLGVKTLTFTKESIFQITVLPDFYNRLHVSISTK